MRGLFWLSDQQWAAIKPHLPYYAAGKRREDDRRIISGIIHVLQSGLPVAGLSAGVRPFDDGLQPL